MIKTIIWGDASHDGHGYTEVATIELVNITWEEVMGFYVYAAIEGQMSLVSRNTLYYHMEIDLETLTSFDYFFCGYGEDSISLKFLETYCHTFFSDEDFEYLRERNEKIGAIPYYELVEYELDVFDLFLAQVIPQIPDNKSILRIDNSESVVHLSIGYGVLYD